MNRFCLVMIVRDEAPIMERCIESIANLIDSYVICDTGSDDNTIEVIKGCMEKRGISGKIITEDWVDFGHNRTVAFAEAYRTYRDAEYLCWLDADEVFITDPKDPVSYMTPDDVDRLYKELESRKENMFRFTTLYGGLEYQRPQIVRNDRLYHWEQPVHEVIASDEPGSSHVLDYYNLARKQGNSSRHPDRYSRDATMFEEYLERNPDDPRATFYLAQTYQSVDVKKSIECYKRRLGLEGFYQERYISMLRLGRLIDDIDEKKRYLFMAHDFIPSRLEALYELLMIHYRKGDHQRASMIGAMASEDREPDPSHLFIEKNIYDYMFDLQYSVSCFYAGKYETAYNVGRSLLDRGKYPNDMAGKVEKNMEFFRSKWEPEWSIMKTVRKESPTLPTVMVIDGFYDDPDSVREKALKQEYSVKGNFPGGRTESFATDKDRDRFERLLGCKITYFPNTYNGSFQYTTAENKSWVHRDTTDFSAVVYLTPDAPVRAGTVMYRHLETGLIKTSNNDEETLLNRDARDQSKWEVIDRIGNRYNRAIIFQGRNTHMSDEYFGNDINDGRLFQTFFFNVE